MKISFIKSIVCLFLCCSATFFTQSQPTSNKLNITNGIIKVQLDETGQSFILTNVKTQKTILKNLLPKSVTGNGTITTMQNPVFGKGKAIVLSVESGTMFFTLYPSQPFLLIHQTINNNGKDTVNLKQLKPVSFIVDLQKTATQLKTLGTGGLLAPDKYPGSYVFLTTVDPVLRNGVVARWLSHEKGSCVIFSAIKNNEVEINPLMDYGRYPLHPDKSATSETLVIGYVDYASIGEEPFSDALAKQYNIKLREPSDADWVLVKKMYGFATDTAAFAFRFNPIDNIDLLAKAAAPVLHLVGINDEVVSPVVDRMVLVERNIKFGWLANIIPCT